MDGDIRNWHKTWAAVSSRKAGHYAQCGYYFKGVSQKSHWKLGISLPTSNMRHNTHRVLKWMANPQKRWKQQNNMRRQNWYWWHTVPKKMGSSSTSCAWNKKNGFFIYQLCLEQKKWVLHLPVVLGTKKKGFFIYQLCLEQKKMGSSSTSCAWNKKKTKKGQI